MRVLEEDRSCREARADIEAFLDGANRHGEFWETLRVEAKRRDIPTIDLPAYRPLDAPERALRETGRAILDDKARYGPHLARVPDGAETVARALDRLDAHALHDRCADALEELARTEHAAVGRGIALSGDAACGKARREARRLAERDEPDEAMRDRLEAELAARLRDPDAGHAFEHDWWGQDPLAAGDRLQLAEWRDAPRREAVVVRPGVDGGGARGAMVALEWAGAEGSAEWVAARGLAGSGVQRASWSDERLREAALARAEAAASADLPLDCRNGLAVGDRVRWIEIAEARGAAREGAPAEMGRAMAVTVEAELVERSIGPREEEERCTLRESWRSDGAELGQAEIPFGLLMAGGAMRAFRDDEKARERKLREQEERRRIEREQEAERQQFQAMRLGMGLR